MSLLLSHMQDYRYHLSKFHIYVLVYCIGGFVSVLLCIIGSSFIHFIRTDSNVFFLITEEYTTVYIYHSFLIYSSADGHLGCFHVLAIINSAAVNIGKRVSFSSGYLRVYAQQWDSWVIWQFYFQILKKSPHYSP